jgi:EmrB/QacA subfamily drug resistance transporter
MAALDIAIVGPALPVIQRDFQVSEQTLAWVFSLYVLGNLVGTPVIAALSDRMGRRLIYTLSIAGFALGSLIVALAPSFAVLLIGRLVQGISAGGIFPVASAVVGDTFPPEQRGSALGLLGAVFGIAFLIGPILGGVLLLFGWPWLFLINLPIALVMIIASLRLLPTHQVAVKTRFDLMGTLILGAALSALAYGLTMLDAAQLAQGQRDPLALPMLIAAVLLFPVFIWVEQRATDPIVQPALFRSRPIRLIAALAVGAGIAETAIVFIPSLLTLAFGVSASTASFMLLVIVLSMAVGSPVSGRMLDRFGSRLVIIGGTLLSAAGLLLLGLFPLNLGLFYLASVLLGLGLAVLLGSALRYVLLNETSASDRAAAQGLLTVTMGVGQLLGAVLVGLIAASAAQPLDGYARALLSIGILMGGLTIVALGLRDRATERERALALSASVSQ